MEEVQGKINPKVLIALGVVAVVSVIVLIWKLSSGVSSDAPPTIVKPANPNDPKYRPDPKLGLGGGGS